MKLSKILGHCWVSLLDRIHGWHVGSCLQKGLNGKDWEKQLTQPSPTWQCIVFRAQCPSVLTSPLHRSPQVCPAHPNPQPTTRLPLVIRWYHLWAHGGGTVIWFFPYSLCHLILSHQFYSQLFKEPSPLRFSRALSSHTKTWLLQTRNFTLKSMLLWWAARTNAISFFPFAFCSNTPHTPQSNTSASGQTGKLCWNIKRK